MKSRFTSLVFLFLSVFVFQACNDDDGPEYDRTALVTVKQDASNHIFFVLESTKETLYPTNDSQIAGYKYKEGQRALIFFSFTDQKKESYDYAVKVYYLYDILTKDAIELTADNEKEVGDDGINPISISISGDYLNIEFYAPSSSADKQLVNLVYNTLNTNQETDYTTLEFRRNKKGDGDGPFYRGMVSFNLKDYAPSVTHKKGIKLRIKALNGEETFYKLDVTYTNSENTIKSIPALNIN